MKRVAKLITSENGSANSGFKQIALRFLVKRFLTSRQGYFAFLLETPPERTLACFPFTNI